MSLRLARTSILALALAVAPVTVSSLLPDTAQAQTFSALRQAIAEASVDRRKPRHVLPRAGFSADMDLLGRGGTPFGP